MIKPFLGKYTPPKIVMVDAGDLAKLGEVFGVDALPIHLGRTVGAAVGAAERRRRRREGGGDVVVERDGRDGEASGNVWKRR